MATLEVPSPQGRIFGQISKNFSRPGEILDFTSRSIRVVYIGIEVRTRAHFSWGSEKRSKNTPETHCTVLKTLRKWYYFTQLIFQVHIQSKYNVRNHTWHIHQPKSSLSWTFLGPKISEFLAKNILILGKIIDFLNLIVKNGNSLDHCLSCDHVQWHNLTAHKSWWSQQCCPVIGVD